jgi:hypothetical protein
MHERVLERGLDAEARFSVHPNLPEAPRVRIVSPLLSFIYVGICIWVIFILLSRNYIYDHSEITNV